MVHSLLKSVSFYNRYRNDSNNYLCLFFLKKGVYAEKLLMQNNANAKKIKNQPITANYNHSLRTGEGVERPLGLSSSA